MKILVPISNVPDTTTKIAFTNGDTEFNAAGVQFILLGGIIIMKHSKPSYNWFP